jgi:ribosomal protein L37AE/L43A
MDEVRCAQDEIRDVLRCPICGSTQSYSRASGREWKCRRCGSSWKLGGEVIQSPVSKLAWADRKDAPRAKSKPKAKPKAKPAAPDGGGAA